jgi:hypothetical protein
MTRKNIFIIITIFTLMVFAGTMPLYAGDVARIGTAGGVQVQVPVGAQSLAMSGANIANVKGLEAIYWNPAGLGNLGGRAAGSFSTMQIFSDIRVNYLALGVNFGRLGTIGFDLKAFDFGDIPVTTNEDMDGLSGQTFAPTFVTTGLTFSKRITDAIAVGFTGKLILESIPRASASAIAFDMGIQYFGLGGIEGVSFGIALKNVGQKMKYTGSAFLVQAQDAGSNINDFREIPTAEHGLPATIEFGLGYTYNINESNSLLIVGNFLNENYGSDAYKFGLEYLFSDFVALRAGYIYQDVDSNDQLYSFTAGFGLNTTVGATALEFGYAYRATQYFDGSNLFSLVVGF